MAVRNDRAILCVTRCGPMVHAQLGVAEEIAEDKVETPKKQAAERNLPQLRPVLGGNDDPALAAWIRRNRFRS